MRPLTIAPGRVIWSMVTETLPLAEDAAFSGVGSGVGFDRAFRFFEGKLEVISEQASLEVGQRNLKLLLEAFLYVGRLAPPSIHLEMAALWSSVRLMRIERIVPKNAN